MRTVFTLILGFLISYSSFSQNGIPANELFQAAKVKAKKEKKNILLIFTATWCQPCRFFKNSLQDVYNKQYFDDNYVILELYDAERGEKKKLENKGADSLLVKYEGDTTSVPYWLILDATGKKLADSYIKKKGDPPNSKGNNMGAPENPEDIDIFISILKKTSRLSDGELRMIRDRIWQLTKLPGMH